MIIFPAVGDANNGNVNGIGEYGNCWSSSLNVDNVNNAWKLNFDSKGVNVNNNNRYIGYTVRPVRS